MQIRVKQSTCRQCTLQLLQSCSDYCENGKYVLLLPFHKSTINFLGLGQSAATATPTIPILQISPVVLAAVCPVGKLKVQLLVTF